MPSRDLITPPSTAALVARTAGRFVRDQARFCWRSGAWWIPLVIVILGIAVLLAATAQAVVPHAVYVMF